MRLGKHSIVNKGVCILLLNCSWLCLKLHIKAHLCFVIWCKDLQASHEEGLQGICRSDLNKAQGSFLKAGIPALHAAPQARRMLVVTILKCCLCLRSADSITLCLRI